MKADSSLQTYLNECARVPLLTAEEELVLGRQVQKLMKLREKEAEGKRLTPKEQREFRAGVRARDRMIQANLRLVVSIAKRHTSRVKHLTLLDLVQEGTLGLMRAVELFDPSRGYKFSTYAYWWIRQGMGRGIAQLDYPIRMPHHIAEKVPRVSNTIHRLMQELKRTPTRAEVAEALGLKEKEFGLLMERSAAVASLDAAVRDDGSELVELVADPSSQEGDADFLVDDFWRLEMALANLEEREREVLVARHELNGSPRLSAAELSKRLGVSKQRVQQIEERAMRKMRLFMQRARVLDNAHARAHLTGHLDKRVDFVSLRRSAQENHHLQLAHTTNGFR